MIEWDVLDDNKNLLEDESDGNDPKRGWATNWWLWAFILLCLVSVGAGLFVWQTNSQEAQLRADLATVIEEETRAQSFGFVERAADLADPRASPSWYGRYVDLFRTPSPVVDPPTITDITWETWRVTIDVEWPIAVTEPFTERRAYRLVNRTWRRTPRLDIQRTETDYEVKTTYFLLQGSEEDMAVFDEDRLLKLGLDGIRNRVVTYWPETWDNYFLSIYIEPQELSPAVYFMDAQKLYINRPSLVIPDIRSPLIAKSQYRYAVITEVIRWLSTPEWVRGLEDYIEGGALPAEEASKNDWIVLLRSLQEAEARRWALNNEQARDIRNAWRAELNGEWVDPFTAPLPLNPAQASPEAKERWLVLNLMLEHHLASGGEEASGRVATRLHGYDPQTFNITAFFEALMGNATDDLERLTRDYVLTQEE